ncbi:MAG TPA: molecular chaperone DjlA [Cryomorphaceae bacterium]|jgi:DnaJ like chaperone protein|nr:MAG: hypothetical protein ABR98_04200 [Cryomorphaceae bacterium BACL7 MAG-120910-bin2]KRO68794.1 MAG: hypothetical protein ABR88_00955 [Cryomorphaceae bacterium BACL7 MAG-120322-bin74]KRO83591.1 MAG: hypothetical protein ABR87_03885 [Cryomorphaceae bacterium BACL7 MAG-121220-bin83]NQW25606.1 molecular chaperone DjiA [Cryomorphaceae bacterium]HAB31516.1 molecular chaperone DjlA [Cryomorphaceae bacterium]|tara:strand:- start:1890 stop:2618 length:729 start_codon:yes stop_codon:yes gene_type:complete
MKRWTTLIGGGIGWALGGPIGLILGAALGNSLSDLFTETPGTKSRPHQRGEQDFHASLLILASVVIKADGQVDERELSFVREHFKRWFGEEKAQSSFKAFKKVVQEKPAITQICQQVRRHMSLQGRIQVVAFLFGLAHSDGTMTPEERQQIARIAGYLGIHPQDFQRLEAVHKPSGPSPFEVLGVSADVSERDLKKTYRSLVKKYHPDALQGMGEDVVKEAEATFRKIQSAYEAICKQRGIK